MDVTEATDALAAATAECRRVERQIWLPGFIYRRRVEAAMREWVRANVAMFDAQVQSLPSGLARFVCTPDQEGS